jgi:hypothetical protein
VHLSRKEHPSLASLPGIVPPTPRSQGPSYSAHSSLLSYMDLEFSWWFLPLCWLIKVSSALITVYCNYPLLQSTLHLWPSFADPDILSLRDGSIPIISHVCSQPGALEFVCPTLSTMRAALGDLLLLVATLASCSLFPKGWAAPPPFRRPDWIMTSSLSMCQEKCFGTDSADPCPKHKASLPCQSA